MEGMDTNWEILTSGIKTEFINDIQMSQQQFTAHEIEELGLTDTTNTLTCGYRNSELLEQDHTLLKHDVKNARYSVSVATPESSFCHKRESSLLQCVLDSIIQTENASDSEFLSTSDEEFLSTSDEESDIENINKDTNNNKFTLKETKQMSREEEKINRDAGEIHKSHGESNDNKQTIKHEQQGDFRNKTSIATYNVNTPKDNYKCHVCMQTFRNKYSYKRHVGTHKVMQNKYESPFQCEVCLKIYSRREIYKNHLDTHTGVTFECEQCDAVFSNKNSLRGHCKVKHSGRKYECSICFKSFVTTLSSFKSHMDIHRGVRHGCNICGKTFSVKATLKTHMKLHSEDKSQTERNYISCDICQKKFATLTNLNLHMQIHLGTQQFKCRTCDARFSRKVDMQRHETIHTGEKPYQCQDCPKRFRSPGDLGRHRRQHKSTQTCKYCGKTYIRKDEFKRHVASHETDIQQKADMYITYTCKICNAILSSDLTLQNHMQKHEVRTFKPNNYVCDICDLVFSTSSNRAKHKRRKHPSPESKSTCDTCSKQFTTVEALEWHISYVHLKHRAHFCKLCDSGYEKKRDLIQHLKTKHPNENISINKNGCIR